MTEDQKLQDASAECASDELENYLDVYSPWLIVDKLRAKELTKEDFQWLEISLRKMFVEGAAYQKPITRAEVVGKVLGLLGSEEMREWYVNTNPTPVRIGDWLEKKLDDK